MTATLALGQAQVQLETLLKLLQGAHSPVQTTPTPALSQLIAQPSIPTAIATAPAQIAAPVATAPPAAAQAASAPAEIATASTAPKRARRSGGMTEAKVNLIIDAILAYNDTPGLTHTDKWGISFPVVKELGKPMGATYQKVIKQVFEDRQTELEAHHQRHGLGSRHNRGKDLRQLPQLIHVKDPASTT